MIRHAESENNAKPVYQRVNDPGITRRGRLQAEHLAEWMKALPVDVLITSPFRRTLLTAEAILARRILPVQVWHDVFESGGCYDGYEPATFTGAAGMSRQQIQNFFVREFALVAAKSLQSTGGNRSESGARDTTDLDLVIDPEIDSDGWWKGRPREDIDATRLRAEIVTRRLVESFSGTGQSIALVIHADFKRELLRVILRDVLCMDAVGAIANASLTTLGYQADGTWQLRSLNSVTHLPPRLITGVPS